MSSNSSPPPAPEVSVVIPAFNARRFIAKTLRAVQTQTVAAVEIIVVDDGSSDGTADLAAEFARDDPRIAVVRQANQGVAAARNRGAADARAEFLAFCDADDWWNPRFLEEALRVFHAAGSDAGVVYAWTVFHDVSGEPVPAWIAASQEGDVGTAIVCQNFIGSGSGVVMRRDAFERAGGYSLRFARENAQGCEDWEMLTRLASLVKFRVVREHLVHYRRSADGMSGDHVTMARSHRLMLDLVFERHPGMPRSVRRLARRNFLMHLASETVRLHRPLDGWRWMSLAVLADPVRLLRRRDFYKLVLRNVAVTLGLKIDTDPGCEGPPPAPGDLVA